MKRFVTRPASEDEASDSEDAITPPARKILKQLLVQEVEKAILSGLQSGEPNLSRLKEHRAASLIPEFDPDNEDCTVTAWLKKIEQLGDIYGWDDKTKSFYLQDKLRGQARKWYNRLEEYDFTWEQWKQMLLRAFPKHRDYANAIEEMITRKKLPSESMTKYYQEKIAMCFRCKLSDAATVSCIIRGLPHALQSNARAFQCERPDDLYEGFLSAFDDYRVPVNEVKITNKDGSYRQVGKKPVDLDTDPCPRCKKTGHLVRNCPLPDQRSCFKCGAQGHIAPRCPTILKSVPEFTNAKEVKLLREFDNIYKKPAKINGAFVKTYIDTGSQVNVISSKVSELLQLNVIPVKTELKGFAGGLITSHGKAKFDLEIDQISIPCDAYLVDIDMNGICLLIGQPIINSEGTSLIVKNGRATLERNDDFLSNMQAIEEVHRFKVVTATSECLPPGTSIIKVKIIGNSASNDVVTSPRHYDLQGISYSLPATLMKGVDGYLKVVNTGSKDVEWEEGTILSRAESCQVLPTDDQDGRV
ncbi:uncharacterized protein LOC123723301 [Papilio machaon]|uniref:uncharacterized protein LOC123723301 n=1 Tax=Papilio machaon TaxID=76193 RepID=UPI001E66325F|nr:uncharacterized protein LOC123723301 [Papilio machaon]